MSINDADADRLERFLRLNYPNIHVPDGNIVDWAINALMECEEIAGRYSAEAETIQEILDLYKMKYGEE